MLINNSNFRKNTTLRNLLSVVFLFFALTVFAQKANEFVMPGLYGMPKTEVQPNKKKEVSRDAVRADLHRFMGFEQLPARYLSLPYDTFQRTNVTVGSMNGVSFLLLLLLPILFLFPTKFLNGTPLTNLLTIVLCVLMLLISIPSAFLNHNNFSSIADAKAFLKANPSSGFLGNLSDKINGTALELYQPIYDWFSSVSGASDPITYPILIGLFTVILFLLYRRTRQSSIIDRLFICFLAMYFFLWWILGSGGSWYGMMLFCLPFIFLIKGMSLPTNFNFTETAALVGKPGMLIFACGIWLFFAFTFRTANYYPVSFERAKHIYIPPFVEYQTGNLSKSILINSTFPAAVEFEKVVNQTDGLVYRVGTQMNFFIEKNDRRVFSDTFLDFFESMVQKFRNKNKITRALKARGFDYIIFDLNLAMNDQTPEKALTRKFTNFLNTLYNNPNVELALTDRTLKMKNTGQIVTGVFPANSTIGNPGRLAVFRLK